MTAIREIPKAEPQMMTSEPPEAVVAAEDERTKKLDLITDIQLILIRRIQNMVKWVVAIVAVAVLCLATVVVGVVVGVDIRDDVTAIRDDVRAVTGDQKAMMEAQEESHLKAEKVAEDVKETKEKVQEVADNVPKVEIDPETGEKVLVVTEKRPPKPKGSAAPAPKGKQYPPRPSWHKRPPPQGKYRVPLPALK